MPRGARDRLFWGIIGTASLFGVGYVALYLGWGAGPVVAEAPWFNAVAFVCQFLAAGTVAILAFGRYQVQRGPLAYWIGLGYASYGLLVVFYLLAWPGLLPARILTPRTQSAAWLVMLMWSVLALCLLAAVPVRRAPELEGPEGRGSDLLTLWLGAVTLIGVLAVVGDRWLPALVTAAGRWTVPAGVWLALVTLAYAVGVACSTRQYRVSGDTLPGYVALNQLALAFGMGAVLIGGKRYDLWWYLARVLLVGGFLAMMGGLLAEYVALFRREQAKTREAQAQAAALQQAEAALQEANAMLEARVQERTADLQEANIKLEQVNTELQQSGIQQEEINAELQQEIEERRTAETALAEANAALRESEARYHGLVDLAPDAVLVHQDWQIVYANAAAVRLYGAASAEDLCGRHRLDLIHPDDRDIVRTRVRQVQAGGTTPIRELRHRRLDGREMLVEATAAPVEWQGKPAVQVIIRDITDRKQAEASLRQAHAELEQRVQERTAELSQAVQQLEQRSAQLRDLTLELALAEQRERRRVADVLHGDLQQLLVGAKLLLSPVAQAAEPAVRAAGREVSDLLQQALRCSRSLTEELSPPILRQGDLLPTLEWLARWMGEKHNFTVALRAERTILLDSPDTAILLFQSIRELLLNAVKHAQVQAAEVDIRRPDDQIQVIISDAGVGFDPAALRVAGGTAGGFGLFGMRERLEFLGGGLKIESAPGRGSRFTLWLPQGRTAGPAPAGVAVRKIRVLVVDDHRVVRQGLVRLLIAEPDIEVVDEAADGLSAITLAEVLRPDVITMDINMPGLDGIEATRRIHAAVPAIQIIGLSVHEEPTQAAAMREAGAVAYLTKSAPSEDLVAAIRACRPGTKANDQSQLQMED